MSLVSAMPVTEGRRKAAMREFSHSPGRAYARNVEKKDAPLGRNKWITYNKRRQGLDDKTWQCAAPSRATHCPALGTSLHPTCTGIFPASQHPPDSLMQPADPVVTLVCVCVAATR